MRFDVLGRIITARVASVRASTGRTSAPAGSCSCSGPARSTARRTPTSRRCRGRAIATRAPRCRRRSSRSSRTSRSSTCARSCDTIQSVVNNVTLAVTVVGGAGAVQRRPDPHRRRVDDEVPPRLRGRDSEDARREQPADRDDAAPRVRRARRDRRHRRRARRDRAELGGRPLRARAAVGADAAASPSAASSPPPSSSRRSACWPASTCCGTSRLRRSAPSRYGLGRAKILACSKESLELSRMDVAIYQGRAAPEARRAARRHRRQAAAVDDGEQLRPPGRHGRPGQRQQRSPHPAQAEADRRQDPAGDRGSAAPDRAGHLRRLPRLRRADRRSRGCNAIPWTRVCITCKEKQKA